MANIQDLENSPNVKYLTLLNLFAYGTYKSLAESGGSLPELTDLMRRKLRLLTVVSLAEQNKLLAYSLLMAELETSTVRELEDLVIEGISAGVVQGKLDQKSSCFEVDFVIGRDIRKIDMGTIASVLTAWCDNCDSMLTNIETQVDKVNKEKSDSEGQRQRGRGYEAGARLGRGRQCLQDPVGGTYGAAGSHLREPPLAQVRLLGAKGVRGGLTREEPRSYMQQL